MATQITTVAGFTSGDDTISTNELSDFLIDALAGDDAITVTEAASDFELQARGGEDLITANSDADDSLVKGGADSDTFDFKGAITNVSVYGGKGGDSITFDRTIVGGIVSGDTGADEFTFNGKVSGGVSIDGGAGDDTFAVNERLTDVTLRGGESRDSIDINENSSTSLIELGGDNDILTIGGKHNETTVKGGADDDTITIDTTDGSVAAFSGTGNKFYGGKGEDSIELESAAKVAIYGDNDEDIIFITGNIVSEGASIYGGEGIDTIDLTNLHTAGSVVSKGNSGDDSFLGAEAVANVTVYGGQGNDTINSQTADASNTFYGDKGDDVITLRSQDKGLASGGEGADQISVMLNSSTADEFHSIDGGDGVDTITFGDGNEGLGSKANNYKVDDKSTQLYYSSFAEFLAEGDVIDSITITDADGAQANITGAMTVTDSDEFNRVRMSNGDRTAAGEGLILATATSVTAGSNIAFEKDAYKSVAGVDLSAGTTGNSVIDNSAAVLTGSDTLGMLLVGGEGKNTIKGGDGADAIVGGDQNDLLTGGDGADQITANGGLKDTIDAGAGADKVVFGTNLNKLDSVVGGSESDELEFTDGNSADDELTLVSGFETITLGAATTSIDVFDENVTSTGTLAITAAALTTQTLTLDGTDVTSGGKLLVTGGAVNDTITSGSGADTIIGGDGSDSINLGTGSSVLGYTAAVDAGTAASFAETEGDVITGFTTGTDKVNFNGDFLTAAMGGTNTDGAVAKTYGGNLNQNDVDGSSGRQSVVVFAAGVATATKADLLTIADLNTAAGTLSNGAANDEFVFIFNAGSGHAAIYKFTDDNNDAAIETAEVQLIGISDAAIAATDIAFNA